jgi:hypothetical protein
VVANAFYSEMHQNDIFYFLKIIFDISVSKQSKTYKKLIFSKNIFLNFLETRVGPRFQTHT